MVLEIIKVSLVEIVIDTKISLDPFIEILTLGSIKLAKKDFRD
jgi:hypothetical protein